MILEETCGKQESRAQDTEEVTFGEFDKLWINHGKAPQMASYEYMIRVQPKQEEPEELPYHVLFVRKMAFMQYEIKKVEFAALYSLILEL